MSSKHLNKATGKLGEHLGENYLRERGYQIIERNVRSPFGEIDLVAREGNTLVFIEIKTRRDSTFGFPEEAVDSRKKDKIIRLASWYLAQHPKVNPAVRFDVLAIQMKGSRPLINLIQNAFEAPFD